MFNSMRFKTFNLQHAGESQPLLFKKQEDSEHSKMVLKLKALILEKMEGISEEYTEIIVHETELLALGKDYKSAEAVALSMSYKDEPFFNRVCDALMADPDVQKCLAKQERFEYARFSVSENLLRDKELNYFTHVQVILDWAPPKLKCSII